MKSMWTQTKDARSKVNITNMSLRRRLFCWPVRLFATHICQSTVTLMDHSYTSYLNELIFCVLVCLDDIVTMYLGGVEIPFGCGVEVELEWVEWNRLPVMNYWPTSKLVFSLTLRKAALRASAFEYSAFVESHNAGSKCQQWMRNEISASVHFFFAAMLLHINTKWRQHSSWRHHACSMIG